MYEVNVPVTKPAFFSKLVEKKKLGSKRSHDLENV